MREIQMTAFDTAWDLIKADTGMWDEIYADLYEKLGGRGRGKTDNTGGLPGYKSVPLDFMPTDVAMELLQQHIEPTSLKDFRETSGDKKYTVDDLIESIMEDGFRLDDTKRTNYVVPNFRFDKEGNMEQWEGRHRTQALSEMGAPYIPSFGIGDWPLRNNVKAIKNPFDKINPIFTGDESQYSAAAYFGPNKARYGTPPSWIFNQELVPGMGRLLPVIDGKPISDEKMTQHMDNVDMNDWVERPEWKVFHD